MLLYKFALKAKKQLGAVKVIQMVKYEKYAYETLTYAAMSDDKDLVDVAKEVSHELDIGKYLVSAIDSFIQSTKALGNNDEGINEYKQFLVKLSNYLYGVRLNGESYRRAVDEMILNIDINDHKRYIDWSRRFYRYCNVKDNSTNTDSEQSNQKRLAQKEKLMELWICIDGELLTESESWPLGLYSKSLQQRGLQKDEAVICIRIAKILIIELRKEKSFTKNIYRDVVERVHLLFQREDLRRLFLSVAREFYHFW